jgi:hypothetical protein
LTRNSLALILLSSIIIVTSHQAGLSGLMIP